MISNIPEDWEEKRITRFSEIISGSTPSTTNPRYWNGDIIWITPDDLSGNSSIYMKSSSRKISRFGLKNCSVKIIPKNSIVISSRAPIGYIAIMTVDYTTNQGCKSLKLKNVSPEFIYYDLLFNMEKIKNLGEGTTFSEISKGQFEKVTLLIPKFIKEQQKIASILQTIDNDIGKTKDLIEKYIKIKEGLIQDIFNDFDNPLKWNVQKLSSFAFAADIDHKMPSDVEYGVPFVSAKDITDEGEIILKGVKTISESDYKRLSRKIKPQIGDMIYSRIGTIGRVSLVKKQLKFLMSYSCCIIRITNKKVYPEYLTWILKSGILDRQLIKETQSIGVPDLGLDKIEAFKIPLPVENNEQINIVNRLNTIQEKVVSECAYLSKLLKVKTGLMQDLLTGKVRVAS